MSVDKLFLRGVNIGDVILYKLKPQDLQVNPDKNWRGKVLRVHINEPRVVDCLFVESLEPGEAGETEIVYPSQIVGKEGT